MNWTEEDIDQLFKDSANQLNVPFQESYWTEMEALLPQTKKKKGLGWIFGGTIVCIALISTFFFPVQSENSNLEHSIHNERKQHFDVSSSNGKNTQLTNNQTEIESKSDLTPNALNIYTKSNNEKAAKTNKIAKIDHGTISEIIPENKVSTELNNEEELIDESFNSDKLSLLSIPRNEVLLANSNFKLLNLKKKSNSIYVQFGAGFSESFMETNKSNWMPTINIGAGYQYTPQGFGFTAGLNLNTSFSNNLEINRKSKVYNFGSTNYEQNFRYKQIYTLELPISIDYRRNRQTFSIGVAPTFIASSLMRFSQLENGEMSQDEFYIGQKVGLKHFGIKPSIAYQLELSKGWNVGIQLNTQLLQQVDDSQFIGTIRNNPLSGQITVRKTITKF
jgi:hypothetical protein